MSFERDSENGEGCISVQVGRSTGPFSKRHRRPFVRDPPCRARGIVGPVGTMRACRMHPDLRFLRSTTASWSSSSRAFEGHPPQATHLENPGKAGTALCGSKSWRPTHRAPHRALSPPGADRARWSGLYGSKPCGVPAFPGFSRVAYCGGPSSKILEFFTLGRWARGGPASVAEGWARVPRATRRCQPGLTTDPSVRSRRALDCRPFQDFGRGRGAGGCMGVSGSFGSEPVRRRVEMLSPGVFCRDRVLSSGVEERPVRRRTHPAVPHTRTAPPA